MTRRSKKVRDRAVCPKRRGGKRIKVASGSKGFCGKALMNAVDGDLSASVFIGKVKLAK